MNVDLFLRGSSNPAFDQWLSAHPNSSMEDQETIAIFVESDIFKSWQRTHPTGTVDQYRYEVQQQNLHYLESRQSEIDQLENEMNQLKADNEQLFSEIQYNRSIIINLQETCKKYKTTSISLVILVGILAFVLWKKWK